MALDKNRKQLEVLQEEIGKALLGESVYTPEKLKEAINTIKARITKSEEQLQELDYETIQENEMTEAVLPAYKRFKSWAEEFDTANKEQKKMIACQLLEHIELGKGYKVALQMNVTYKQFCFEYVTAKEIQGIA